MDENRTTAPADLSGSAGDDRQIHLVLDISVRAMNCLYRENIMTMGQLLACTQADLMEIRAFGAGALGNVTEQLARHGLALAGEGVPRTSVEQQADIALRQAHMAHWLDLVRQIRESEEAALIRQASVPEEPGEDVVVEFVDTGRRTFFMSATRRVHADNEVCDHAEKCPEPSWWQVECTCGWSARDVSKLEVRAQRLGHGAEYHNNLGQSAW